jgi:hypothetical protein
MTDRPSRRARPFEAIVAAMKRAQPQRHAAEAEQRTRERARVSYAEAKAAADRNHAVVLGLIAEHRKHVRVHPLEPVDDMTAADVIAAEVIAAGELARAGGPVMAPPDKDSVAGQILEAGRKRRMGEA